jgi:hypothetical protein
MHPEMLAIVYRFVHLSVATVWSGPVTVRFFRFRPYVDNRTELNQNLMVGFSAKPA